MRHTTCFDTNHLCTALKPILCIFFYHRTSYTTPSASFNLINFHQRIAFRLSFEKKKEVNMRLMTCFDTIQPLIYHLCTALKPILCILYHIISYTTPSASFNFDQTSSTYCFWIQLWSKHGHYEAHDQLRYNPALLYHLCTVLKPILYNLSYNFLYTTYIALKPMLCILCPITSYTTAPASFNFD